MCPVQRWHPDFFLIVYYSVDAKRVPSPITKWSARWSQVHGETRARTCSYKSRTRWKLRVASITKYPYWHLLTNQSLRYTLGVAVFFLPLNNGSVTPCSFGRCLCDFRSSRDDSYRITHRIAPVLCWGERVPPLHCTKVALDIFVTIQLTFNLIETVNHGSFALLLLTNIG